MKISILTPCYNSSKFIERLFNSLQNQTDKNFQWIVIDDCSKDNTADLLKDFQKKANFEMILIQNPTNKMISYNLNLGVQNSTGDFITFIGHDDEFKPEAIQEFKKDWYNLSKTQQQDLGGIIYNTNDQNGNLIGTPFPTNYFKRFLYEV